MVCGASFVFLFIMPMQAPTPAAGDKPQSAEQLAKLHSARLAMAEAMKRRELPAIEKAELSMRDALGAYAGVPEEKEALLPLGTKPPRVTTADFSKLAKGMGTLASGSDAAKANRMELRHSAYLAMGLLAAAEAGVPEADGFRKQAVLELDFLVSKQATEGYFPYPADPVAPEHLQKLAAKVSKEFPDKVKDGYIHIPADGAQFDTGCCAAALADGYEATKEKRYLDAASKAGDWAIQQPLSTNWNYNSFSVWQLAGLHQVTKERKYLDGAVELARLGVLPGQLPTGRWSDQHNAKRVYHWIMVRGLVALLKAMPADHPHLKEIRGKTKLAIDARVEDTLRDGAGKEVHALVALCEALEYFGPDDKWQKALEATGGISPYGAGVLARHAKRGSK